MRMISLPMLIIFLGLTSGHDLYEGTRFIVFGGNGFMGTRLVERLLEKGGVKEILILNRGSRYWDAEERVFNSPLVTHINCDRDEFSTCLTSIKASKLILKPDFNRETPVLILAMS